MYQIIYLCSYDTHACKNLPFILKGIVEKNNCILASALGIRDPVIVKYSIILHERADKLQE